MTARTYSTRRYAIVNALVEKLKEINGSGSYVSNLNKNVFNKLKFYDELNNTQRENQKMKMDQYEENPIDHSKS